MRPEILNPLFGETQSLKGVGKALAKPLEKLRLTRIKDLLYHQPSYWMRTSLAKGLITTSSSPLSWDSVIGILRFSAPFFNSIVTPAISSPFRPQRTWATAIPELPRIGIGTLESIVSKRANLGLKEIDRHPGSKGLNPTTSAMNS